MTSTSFTLQMRRNGEIVGTVKLEWGEWPFEQSVANAVEKDFAARLFPILDRFADLGRAVRLAENNGLKTESTDANGSIT